MAGRSRSRAIAHKADHSGAGHLESSGRASVSDSDMPTEAPAGPPGSDMTSDLERANLRRVYDNAEPPWTGPPRAVRLFNLPKKGQREFFAIVGHQQAGLNKKGTFLIIRLLNPFFLDLIFIRPRIDVIVELRQHMLPILQM